ncbi:hypothetical protein FHY35_000003 [Xanthomonas arboricola]|uniref:hypothetical protein n=1 Tax=Xanthomonas arboricola TaxID=56448 RepID=UPI00141BACE4|nr:hypothetical protein [Xanthomonas arboricola]NIJ83048.1 hypothetical protein [Xanthomonas arboricola]
MTDSLYMFQSEQEAAKAMLLEVTQILNRKTIDYAVVGGWVPYLFNCSPVAHPGTFDVDIVLNTALNKDDVILALDSMINDFGYMRAPKNAFQVYRAIPVLGETMIFHVDFLHRKYADDTGDLTRSWGRYQSITAPGTDVIFTHQQTQSHLVEALGMDGNSLKSDVTFASEAAFLSTKGRSVGFGKRERDAFDIYLIITQSQDLEKLVRAATALMLNGVFCASMLRMYKEFTADSSAVQMSVKFLCGASEAYRGKPTEAAAEISSRVRDFIRKIDDQGQVDELEDEC